MTPSRHWSQLSSFTKYKDTTQSTLQQFACPGEDIPDWGGRETGAQHERQRVLGQEEAVPAGGGGGRALQAEVVLWRKAPRYCVHHSH